MPQPQTVCETCAETCAVEYLRLALSSFLAYCEMFLDLRIDLKHIQIKQTCLDMDLHTWALSANSTGYCCALFWLLHNHFQDFFYKNVVGNEGHTGEISY